MASHHLTSHCHRDRSGSSRARRATGSTWCVTGPERGLAGAPAGTARRQPGKLYAFFSAKGGSGSTTVAANLAIQIHRLTGQKTVVALRDVATGRGAGLGKKLEAQKTLPFSHLRHGSAARG